MKDYSSIWEGKSIWDAEAPDWISTVLSQAEQEAQTMEEEAAQQEEDEDEEFMNQLLEDEMRESGESRRSSQNLEGIYTSSGGGGKDVPQGGSIAVSHNNPGNIKFGEFAKKYGATEGRRATDGGVFAQFPNVETGLKAKQDLLLGSGYRNLTVDQAMKRWSNNGYGGELYPEIANKKISDLSDEELSSLSQKQIKREDGAMARKMGIKQYGGYSNIREENGEYVGDDADGNVVTINPMYLNSYGFKKNKFDFQTSTYSQNTTPNIDANNDPQALPDEKEGMFDFGIATQSYDLLKNIGTFAKQKLGTVIDGIQTGLDTTISYLGDRQNNENIAKSNKWLAEERYTPITNSRNKERAYI